MPLPNEFIAAQPAMSAAAAATSDYKALVCVFLNGAMDHANAVPPLGTQYAQFRLDRTPALAPTEASILTLNSTPGCGLNAALPGIRALYNAGDAAIICNVGPLIDPLSKADFGLFYTPGPGRRPYQLQSHSDQQNVWYTERPDSPSESTGWFGRAADLYEPAFNAAQTFPSILSVTGRAVMLESNSRAQYQLRSGINVPVVNGFTTPNFLAVQTDPTGSMQRVNADHWATQGRPNILEREVVDVSNKAMSVAQAVDSAAVGGLLATTFPNTVLGRQLYTVARMIRGRASAGHRRQQFFASLGGWDTHSAPFATTNTALLTQLNDAIVAFNAEMVAQGLNDQVTLFTASDFGRALLPNAEGTDHGWGGHHFIIGGAVSGGRLYNRDAKSGPILNTYPTITLGGPWDAGEGRLIPGIAVTEYAATLLKWFGIPDALSNGVNPMNLVLPLLPNHASRDLGFMG